MSYLTIIVRWIKWNSSKLFQKRPIFALKIVKNHKKCGFFGAPSGNTRYARAYAIFYCLVRALLLLSLIKAYVVASKSVQLREKIIKANTEKSVLAFMVLPAGIEPTTSP